MPQVSRSAGVPDWVGIPVSCPDGALTARLAPQVLIDLCAVSCFKGHIHTAHIHREAVRRVDGDAHHVADQGVAVVVLALDRGLGQPALANSHGHATRPIARMRPRALVHGGLV